MERFKKMLVHTKIPGLGDMLKKEKEPTEILIGKEVGIYYAFVFSQIAFVPFGGDYFEIWRL